MRYPPSSSSALSSLCNAKSKYRFASCSQALLAVSNLILSAYLFIYSPACHVADASRSEEFDAECICTHAIDRTVDARGSLGAVAFELILDNARTKIIA